jgi:glycosyltransferase involved in cell wall biosynthesis
MFRHWLQRHWQLARPYGRYLYYRLFPQRRPEYFRAPWTFPTYPLSAGHAAAREWVETRVQDLAFVVLPMVDWHGRFQRSQQLARALVALGYPCLYVNPQLGCEYFLPFAADPESRIANIAPGILELHVHLPREHDSTTRMLHPSECQRVVEAIETTLALSGIRRAAQLVSFPRWTGVAVALRERLGTPILYDWHDFLSGFGRIGGDILASEAELVAAADQILVSSEFLRAEALRRRPEAADRIRMVRNGAAFDDFRTAREAREQAYPAGARFGYVGALDHWFDTELLFEVARLRPDYRFELVGRLESRRGFARLEALPNVLLPGEVPYAALPELLRRWRAGLIPFRLNALTEATDPIKLYEYLAAGLPVVSTPLPEVLRHGAAIRTAARAEEFAQALDRTLTAEGTDSLAWRLETARAECWSARAREVVAAVQACPETAAAAPA